MTQFPSTPQRGFAAPFPGEQVNSQVAAFLRLVYGWMAAGLIITAIVSWLVAGSPMLVVAIASSRLLFWAIIIAQLGLVFALSARVHTLAPTTASVLFVASRRSPASRSPSSCLRTQRRN